MVSEYSNVNGKMILPLVRSTFERKKEQTKSISSPYSVVHFHLFVAEFLGLLRMWIACRDT